MCIVLSTIARSLYGETMPMKNPTHPGRIVQRSLTSLGVSVTEAARRLGVSRSHLSKLLNGHAGISPEMAIRLEKGIGSTADHWLRMQNAYDLE
jgi:addiction module HigA family antidote